MDWASSPVWQEDPEGAQCNLNSNKISVVWWGDKRKCPLLQQCRLPSLPKKKTATQSTFYPHFLADPFASSKIQCDGNFLAVPFCIIKTQCDEKLVLSYSYDGPRPLIWCWVPPHATFKIKRTGAIVAAEYKTSTNMLAFR